VASQTSGALGWKAFMGQKEERNKEKD
jgi:hypothetical protein